MRFTIATAGGQAAVYVGGVLQAHGFDLLAVLKDAGVEVIRADRPALAVKGQWPKRLADVKREGE